METTERETRISAIDKLREELHEIHKTSISATDDKRLKELVGLANEKQAILNNLLYEFVELYGDWPA